MTKEEIKYELICFLNSLKRKKDNFKYKISFHSSICDVWIKKEENKDLVEYKVSFDTLLHSDNLINIRNDLLEIILD